MTLSESEIQIKKLTEDLRQSELRFGNLIESAPDAIIIVDSSGTIQMINRQTEELFGYAKDELYGKKPEVLMPERYGATHINHRESYTSRPKNRFMGEGMELKARRKDGTEINVEIALSNIGDKTQNEVLILAAIRDITSRTMIENEIREFNRTLENRVQERTEELEKSLNEKVIMLQEIHHRVKNNLQTVSSLLRIQSDKIPGSTAAEYLRASEQRIRSMALIHMQLYKTKDFSRINFREYTEELCKYLLVAFGVNGNKITLQTEIENIFFAIDTALPCGLIINEMFTNSLKHAFPDNREGTILIKLYKDEHEVNHLLFKDNGIGIGKDLLIDNAAKLGMLLINTLTEQLEGNIDVDTDGGTIFKIDFKDIEHNTHYRS